MKRLTYFIATLIVLVIGYLSRKNTEGGSFMHDYVGDAIWAAMIYLGFRMVLVHYPLKKSLYVAFIFTYFIEITQLCQADWLNGLRHTWFGGLVLGFGFLWSDLLMYALGIVATFAIDWYVIKFKH